MAEESAFVGLFQVCQIKDWPRGDFIWVISVCIVSVVVTAFDSESGRRGSNPEWG